jgi:hypothetical protein
MVFGADSFKKAADINLIRSWSVVRDNLSNCKGGKDYHKNDGFHAIKI